LKLELSLRKLIEKLIATVFIISILGLMAKPFANSQDNYLNRDYFKFWLAGHMVVAGEDPYSEELWLKQHAVHNAEWVLDNSYLYPLPLAILFAPLGSFSLSNAAAIWVFLISISLIGVLFFIAYLWPQIMGVKYFIPILAGLILFRPIVVNYYWGQIAPFLLVVILGVTALWRRKHWFVGGLLLSMLLLKPQVGIPVVGLLFAWLIFQRKWSALFGLTISTMAIMAVGFMLDMNWFSKWIMVGANKLSTQSGQSTTLWGISTLICDNRGNCSFLTGLVFTLIVLAISVILYLRYPQDNPIIMIGYIICIGLLIPPYLLSSDQLLIVLPVLLAVGMMILKGYPYLLVSSIFLLLSLQAQACVLLAHYLQSDGLSVSLPITAFVFLLLAQNGKFGRQPETLGSLN
jgi:hypothetical protein